MQETPAGTKHADLSFLKIYAGGNNALIEKLVNQFIEKTPAAIAEMEEALAGGDLHRLSRVAHSLKAQVSYMGAKPANELVVQIEHDAREQRQTDLLPAKLSTLKELLMLSYDELKKQLQEL